MNCCHGGKKIDEEIAKEGPKFGLTPEAITAAKAVAADQVSVMEKTDAGIRNQTMLIRDADVSTFFVIGTRDSITRILSVVSRNFYLTTTPDASINK